MFLRLLLCLTFFVLVASDSTNPTIRVAHGLLQGSWKVSTKGRSYASFQGVPYARPPTGKNRFKEPQQLKPWTGVWDASKVLSACMQYDPFEKKITGSEDCLYVNVYTPRLQPGANLPVMVFIHGGAFMFGEGGIYDASNIMDWDMVVVTLNYRLGPLGFLSTGDTVVPGNNGLKDQSFALHWVKHNIMMFGGNPDSVTLTGSSAGGASVHYHYLSPLSRGTFSRGIAYSGSAFTSWAHAIKPAEKAKTLAAIVGCPTSNSKDIVKCLESRPAEVVVNAQFEMLEWKIHLFTMFTPVAEAQGSREPFLTSEPYSATRSGSMMNVPLITSITSEEGLYPAAAYQTDPSILYELGTNWDRLASNIFVYNDTLPINRHAEVAQAIKKQYFGDQPVGPETFPQLVEALGDRLFGHAVGKTALLHAAKSGQPTYVYKYAYRATKSLSNMLAHDEINYGVAHADDVLRIFKFVGMETTTDEEREMADALINMIYSYSTSGVPKLTNGGPVWQPLRPGAAELDYLEIRTPTYSQMKSDPDFAKKSFWDSLGFNEHENYRKFIRDEL